MYFDLTRSFTFISADIIEQDNLGLRVHRRLPFTSKLVDKREEHRHRNTYRPTISSVIISHVYKRTITLTMVTVIRPISRVIVALLAVQAIALFLLALRLRLSELGKGIGRVSFLSSSSRTGRQNCSAAIYSAAAIEDDGYQMYGDVELDLGAIEESKDCVKIFLKKYWDYCEKTLLPSPQYQKNYVSQGNNRRITTICPCISPNLQGKVYVNWLKTVVDATDDPGHHPELHPGGHWRPTWCIPRQRIAIIVPYRDRSVHLKTFLRVIHPFMQRQLHYYTVFVIEQTEPWIFNKATLMNVGFKEAEARDRFDCFIFHDVDMIPEDDLNFYGCYKTPRHIGVYLDIHQYKIWYLDLFGGVTAFTRKQMELVNGFSNEFYGWGGEDDDMLNRVANQYLNAEVFRFPSCVARYTSLKHERDPGNPFRYNGIAYNGMALRPDVYKSNGLNSLTYRLVDCEENLLYTWIAVALPDPPMANNLTTSPTPQQPPAT